EEEQRRPIAATSQTCNEVGTLGHARIQLHLGAVLLQVLAEKLGGSGLIARRVRGVDADQLLQELGDLVAGRDRRQS
ncbi:MAG: hypothetical protein V7645_2337, partial [Actinomycetota bacterium]